MKERCTIYVDLTVVKKPSRIERAGCEEVGVREGVFDADEAVAIHDRDGAAIGVDKLETHIEAVGRLLNTEVLNRLGRRQRNASA